MASVTSIPSMSSESAKNYGSSSVSKTEGSGSTPGALAMPMEYKLSWPRLIFWISREQIYFSLYWPSKKYVEVNYWFNWYYGNPVRMKKLYWSPDKMVAW
jgi:hypothetical protein